MEDPDSPEERDMSTARNVPRLIRPMWRSKRQADKLLITVNAIETGRNKGVKSKQDRMRQCFTTFIMYLELEFQLVRYYGRMVSSSFSILVDKQMYCRRNEAFGKIHKF